MIGNEIASNWYDHLAPAFRRAKRKGAFVTSSFEREAPPDLGSRALIDPEVFERNRSRVKTSFWRKLRRNAGKIPFAEDAVALYFCALDPATPIRVRAVLLAALAYFVVPTDMVPDFVAGLGFTDDASVIAAAVAMVSNHLLPRHRTRAREALLANDKRRGTST